MFGEFDFRTLPMDHEYIAAIVNARHPGKAAGRSCRSWTTALPVHETLQDSVSHEFVGPFGEQVVERTVEWMRVQ